MRSEPETVEDLLKDCDLCESVRDHMRKINLSLTSVF